MEQVYKKLINQSSKKIIGVAKNYLAAGQDPLLKQYDDPFYFFKPWSSIV